MGSPTSSTLTFNTGAPQGFMLSALLYPLFTHDYVATYSSNSIVKFADNMTVIGLISGENEPAYREETILRHFIYGFPLICQPSLCVCVYIYIYIYTANYFIPAHIAVYIYIYFTAVYKLLNNHHNILFIFMCITCLHSGLNSLDLPPMPMSFVSSLLTINSLDCPYLPL